MSAPPPLERVMETARLAALAAGAAAMHHFRRLPGVETKSDGSPVTVADREAEAAVVAKIRAAFPRHAILGEETGAAGSGPSRWIVDPIDGTRGFARGGPMWGPLVAFEHEGEILAGAMALPVLGRTYWAGRGLGCYRDGERVRFSTIASWSEATLSLGGVRRLLEPPHGAAISRLVSTAGSVRAYGDLAACAMLLDGAADAFLENGVKVWDLAPMKILVEEAGGRFTDFAGLDTVATGSAVATNGPLHDHVLAELRRG